MSEEGDKALRLQPGWAAFICAPCMEHVPERERVRGGPARRPRRHPGVLGAGILGPGTVLELKCPKCHQKRTVRAPKSAPAPLHSPIAAELRTARVGQAGTPVDSMPGGGGS